MRGGSYTASQDYPLFFNPEPLLRETSESCTFVAMIAAVQQLHQAVAEFISQGTGSLDELLMQTHVHQRQSCAAYDAYCQAFAPATEWKKIPTLP